MSWHARRIASVPVRTSAQTWRHLIEILNPPLGARGVLEHAVDAAAIAISEESTIEMPMILTGCGPQVRIYTVHGEDAIDGTNVNETSIPGLRFTDSWQMS